MLINQAILILTALSQNLDSHTFNQAVQALNMSISALQQIDQLRKLNVIPMPDDLEGETHIWQPPLTSVGPTSGSPEKNGKENTGSPGHQAHLPEN